MTAFVPVRIRLVTPISLWTTPAAVRPFAGSVLRMGWFLAAENRSLVMIVGSTPTLATNLHETPSFEGFC